MTDTTTSKSTWGAILAFLLANWSWITLAIGAIGGLILFNSYQKDKQALSEIRKTASWSDSVSNSKIVYYKDQAGKEHARAENLAIHDVAMQAYADSVSKALKIKSDQISSINNTDTHTDISVKPTVDSAYTTKVPCKGDSVTITQAFSFHFDDNYLHLSGRVGLGAVNNIHATLDDTLRRVDYWKRKWFLGSKTYYSDLSNTNPYVKISGYKGVELAGVTDQEKKWSIGPVLAVGYGPGATLSKPQFFAGIGLMYTIKKF